jgi:hypothetical protein
VAVASAAPRERRPSHDRIRDKPRACSGQSRSSRFQETVASGRSRVSTQRLRNRSLIRREAKTTLAVNDVKAAYGRAFRATDPTISTLPPRGDRPPGCGVRVTTLGIEDRR